MDYATFQASTAKIDETQKAYQKAMAREEKIEKMLKEAKAQTKKAKETYVNALQDAQRVVEPKSVSELKQPEG